MRQADPSHAVSLPELVVLGAERKVELIERKRHDDERRAKLRERFLARTRTGAGIDWERWGTCTIKAGRTRPMADGYGGAVLLDSSAWARIGLGRLQPQDQERWEAAVRGDEVIVSPPFALKALCSACDADDFRALVEELGGFRQLRADDRTWQLAAEAQAALAADAAVSHRVKPIDLLLAAVADQNAVGVLHYDHDYDTIRSHSPLAFRSVWVAERGSMT